MIAGAWCTAGFSNALRVGDRATVLSTHAGTINIVVMVNRPLTSAAMVEAVQIAAEARTLAVLEAGSKASALVRRRPAPAPTVSRLPRRRARPRERGAERYCGKHTLLGELIGRAVLESCARAIRRIR